MCQFLFSYGNYQFIKIVTSNSILESHSVIAAAMCFADVSRSTRDQQSLPWNYTCFFSILATDNTTSPESSASISAPPPVSQTPQSKPRQPGSISDYDPMAQQKSSPYTNKTQATTVYNSSASNGAGRSCLHIVIILSLQNLTNERNRSCALLSVGLQNCQYSWYLHMYI